MWVCWLAVFEAFRSAVTAEGIGGLYKGFWPTLLRDVPEIAIQVLSGKSPHHTLTFMLHMMSLHTEADSQMGNDFLMHVWMLVSKLFRDMVDWEFCKGQLDLSPGLGWATSVFDLSFEFYICQPLWSR
jgi:hypothetical protein